MGTIARKIILTDKAPISALPLSQAVQMGNMLFLSGQLGMNTREELADGFGPQARLALDNIRFVLEAAGGSFKNVVKFTVLFERISDMAELNTIFEEYLPQPYPARTAYQVGTLPLGGALVEIEAIAILGNVVDP